MSSVQPDVSEFYNQLDLLINEYKTHNKPQTLSRIRDLIHVNGALFVNSEILQQVKERLFNIPSYSDALPLMAIRTTIEKIEAITRAMTEMTAIMDQSEASHRAKIALIHRWADQIRGDSGHRQSKPKG